MLIILTLRKKDSEFKVILGYIESLCFKTIKENRGKIRLYPRIR